jgi:hypothetical protein
MEKGKKVSPEALATDWARSSATTGMVHPSCSSHSDGGQFARPAAALVEIV